MDDRQKQLQTWLKQTLNKDKMHLTPIQSDASFRRYFRVSHQNKTFIAMDSPPDKEPCQPYIKIAAALNSAGLTVPKILEQNTQDGFLLLSDLGDKLFINELSAKNANALYQIAIEKLLHMQKIWCPIN